MSEQASAVNEIAGEQETEARSPLKIQRYTPAGIRDCMDEDQGGQWVKYDDHVRAMLNPQGLPLARDMASLYRLFQFMLDNIADLESEPDFAGFQMQRLTNEETGELLCIRLIPCDNIAGITAPRIAEVKENPVIKQAVRDSLHLVRP